MIPEYKYRVHDESVATPYFKKWLVEPLIRFVPWGIPANIITILSNLLMYVALWMALVEWPSRELRFILIPLLVLGYAIGDHLDGMQAKRTGTSSPLGELCDHFLDIFNNGIMIFIVCLSFGITQPYMVAFFLTAAYLPHATMFYEQFSTKWLYFEKIGSLESLIILLSCVLVSTFEPVYLWAIRPVAGELSIARIAFIVSSSGAFLTIIKIIRRAHIVNPRYYIFCLLLIVVSCTGMTFLPAIPLFYVITLYSSLFIGNLQRGHLADGKARYPDFIVPVFMIAAFLFAPLRQPVFLWCLYIYLTIHIIWIAGNCVKILHKFWVWKNPRKI